MLLLAAAKIIFPIIWAEGIRAVFFPALAPKPYIANQMRKVPSTAALS